MHGRDAGLDIRRREDRDIWPAIWICRLIDGDHFVNQGLPIVRERRIEQTVLGLIRDPDDLIGLRVENVKLERTYAWRALGPCGPRPNQEQ